MRQDPLGIGLSLRGPPILYPCLQLLAVDPGKGSGEVAAKRGQRRLEQMKVGAGKGGFIQSAIGKVKLHDLGNGSRLERGGVCFCIMTRKGRNVRERSDDLLSGQVVGDESHQPPLVVALINGRTNQG